MPMDWLCHHCGERKVEFIPDGCPNCGKRLTRPVGVLEELKVQEDNRFLDLVESYTRTCAKPEIR